MINLKPNGLSSPCQFDESTLHSKTHLKWPLKKKTKNWFQDRLSLNAGQKFYDLYYATIFH